MGRSGNTTFPCIKHILSNTTTCGAAVTLKRYDERPATTEAYHGISTEQREREKDGGFMGREGKALQSVGVVGAAATPTGVIPNLELLAGCGGGQER